jgi:hypothetical protein
VRGATCGGGAAELEHARTLADERHLVEAESVRARRLDEAGMAPISHASTSSTAPYLRRSKTMDSTPSMARGRPGPVTSRPAGVSGAGPSGAALQPARGLPLGGLLALEREQLLELLAAQLGGGDQPRLVLAMRRDLGELGDVVAAKAQGEVARLVRLPAEQLEGAARGHQRRVERLALDQRHADLVQLVVVLDVAGAGDDDRVRKVLADHLRALDALLDVVDRDDDHPGPVGAGDAHQVEPGRVAVVNAPAELAQRLDRLGIVVEHGRRDAVGEQHPADDLPVAAEAGDDDRVRSAAR